MERATARHRRARALLTTAIVALSCTSCVGLRGRSGSSDWWRVGVDVPIGQGSRSKALHCKQDEKIAKVDGKVRCVPKQPNENQSP